MADQVVHETNLQQALDISLEQFSDQSLDIISGYLGELKTLAELKVNSALEASEVLAKQSEYLAETFNRLSDVGSDLAKKAELLGIEGKHLLQDFWDAQALQYQQWADTIKVKGADAWAQLNKVNLDALGAIGVKFAAELGGAFIDAYQYVDAMLAGDYYKAIGNAGGVLAGVGATAGIVYLSGFVSAPIMAAAAGLAAVGMIFADDVIEFGLNSFDPLNLNPPASGGQSTGNEPVGSVNPDAGTGSSDTSSGNGTGSSISPVSPDSGSSVGSNNNSESDHLTVGGDEGGNTDAEVYYPEGGGSVTTTNDKTVTVDPDGVITTEYHQGDINKEVRDPDGNLKRIEYANGDVTTFGSSGWLKVSAGGTRTYYTIGNDITTVKSPDGKITIYEGSGQTNPSMTPGGIVRDGNSFSDGTPPGSYGPYENSTPPGQDADGNGVVDGDTTGGDTSNIPSDGSSFGNGGSADGSYNPPPSGDADGNGVLDGDMTGGDTSNIPSDGSSFGNGGSADGSYNPPPSGDADGNGVLDGDMTGGDTSNIPSDGSSFGNGGSADGSYNPPPSGDADGNGVLDGDMTGGDTSNIPSDGSSFGNGGSADGSYNPPPSGDADGNGVLDGDMTGGDTSNIPSDGSSFGNGGSADGSYNPPPSGDADGNGVLDGDMTGGDTSNIPSDGSSFGDPHRSGPENGGDSGEGGTGSDGGDGGAGSEGGEGEAGSEGGDGGTGPDGSEGGTAPDGGEGGESSCPIPPPPPPPAPPATPGSPLILDLDGDGIETVGLSSKIHFDHGGDTFRELTGFAASDDGFLALDLNGDGKINNGSELFGNETLLTDGSKASNGFQALAALDANGDEVVDFGDAAFADLRVWRDLNQNGETDEGELSTLVELGVQSLSVTYADQAGVDEFNNEHRQVGSYTNSAGQTMGMTDVWFARNLTETKEEVVEVSAGIAELPNALGFGQAYSLHQAMARDDSGELQSLVAQFISSNSRDERQALTEKIIFAWTDQEGDYRAYYQSPVDARKIGALEAFYGYKVDKPNGTGQQYAVMFDEIFTNLVDTVFYQLAARSYLQPFFREISWTQDEVSGLWLGDFSEVIDDLFSYAETHPENSQEILQDFVQAIRGVNAYEPVNVDRLLDTLVQSFQSDSLPAYSDGAIAAVIAAIMDTAMIPTSGDDIIDGNANNNILFGLGGNDTLDGKAGSNRLYGGAGDDILKYDVNAKAVIDGGAGNDTIKVSHTSMTSSKANSITGGTGNDVITAGHGAETYLFRRGDGQDVMTDFGGVDKLVFGSGIAAGDLAIRRVGNNLLVQVTDPNDAAATDQLTIVNWFSSTAYQIETFAFADGSSLTAAQLTQLGA
ncbi:hypothetical protein HP532_10260, partial [Pseudomonas sp. CrR25]|nr:hypothetical protein [Pseudomonas sp. CrR25]